MDTYFVVTAPGLEPFAAKELFEMGLLPATGRESGDIGDLKRGSVESITTGGVAFKGDLSALILANMHLRTASRILARLGNFFHATSFTELQKRASRLPWERFITPGQPISLRVTCHKSKLYHSEAVLKSIATGLEERLGKPAPLVKTGSLVDGHPPQLIVVRLFEDKCTVSVDSSGELLHKRGYRQAVAKAPLRETLAAALIMASGWDRTSALLDPFCGSGTIPIEAAMMAHHIPPGLNRHFAFMGWPEYDGAVFPVPESAATRLNQSSTIKNNSGQAQIPAIQASDRDAGAIKMAIENAERAGVEDLIEFKCQAVSSITPPAGSGWVVTNPPYGLRISEGKDLRNLYAQFGNVLRNHCSDWQVAVLGYDPVLLGQMHMEMDTSIGFVNGGIRVRVARGKVE